MAALLVVAVILAGVFWYSTRATLFGDPEPPPASPAVETMPTPIPVQRLDQVREDLNRSLEAAQERRQQAQEQMGQP